MFDSFKFYFYVSMYMYMFMCTRVPTDSERGCPVDSLVLAIEHGCWEPNSGCLEAGVPTVSVASCLKFLKSLTYLLFERQKKCELFFKFNLTYL